MGRIVNFSAGPAMLPLSVLETARDEMLDYRGSGMSVMEMSHRSKEYMEIITGAEALVRELMELPANYRVLLLQGGATLQFSMVPMNLLTSPEQSADYLLTGSWSKKAAKEAAKVGKVRIAATSEPEKFTRIPRQEELDLSPEAVYVHMTSNNTIYGTEYFYTPDTGKIPLVADMSSNILSRPIEVSRYGIIYAGAQKNLGPSGVTLVVIREDLLGRCTGLPVMLDYQIQTTDGSMHNTPPTYAIYILGLVLAWMKREGGVQAIEAQNIRKAAKLYAAIEASALYHCPNEVASRSRMNVPFVLRRPELTDSFLAEAKKAGLVSLKGHRSVGGVRASIYNAMPESGIETLVDFMNDFATRNE